MLIVHHSAFLRDARLSLRYTQVEMAALLQVSESTWRKAEISPNPRRHVVLAVITLCLIRQIPIDLQYIKHLLAHIPPTQTIHVGDKPSETPRKPTKLTPLEKRKLAAAQQRLGEFARNYVEYERINGPAALQDKLRADLKVVDSDITGRYADPFGALFRRFVAIVQRTGVLPDPYDL